MSYPFAYPSYPSYGSPVTSPVHNSREKYLAALAEAKAAEAEYLAAQKLQQEEDALRTRLEQIQQMKYHPAANSYTPAMQYPPQYHQPASQYSHAAPAPLDLDALRRQIAAEERAQIVREQEQARELEALRIEEIRKVQQARELEARRAHEARKAQHARDKERSRALAAQRSEFVSQHAPLPAVRFVVSADSNARAHHCRPGHACHESRNTRCAPKQVKEDTVDLQDLIGRLFGGHIRQPEVKKAQAPTPAPAASQVVSLEELLQHVLGDGAAAPKPEVKATPQAAPVTLEQLIGHFFGAASVAQPEVSTSGSPSASTSKSTPPQDSVKPTAPVPSTPAAPPAKAAAPAPTPAAPAGMGHILNHFLGGAAAQASASDQVDIQQLMNMFIGGSAPAHNAHNACSKSETGNCASSQREDMAAREERELAEAIRLSLAESHAAPASPTESTKSKGKAPAPAPIPDVASSTAEVHAIDAAFSALAGGFAFPAQLDFSTSRAASPTRSGTTTPGSTSEESAVAKLSYSALSQPVRVYHQALSALLARLDAVDSLGDEGLRHARKEVVGRVESALDEVEKVIEARWRKFVGREVRVGTEPAPVAVGDAAEALAVQPLPETTVTPAAEPSLSPSPAGEPESHPLSASPAAPAMPSETPVTTDAVKAPKPRKSDADSDWSEVDA